MVKVQVNPHKDQQTVKLSDGSEGFARKVNDEFDFEFSNHLHPAFWTPSTLNNHEVFNVHSIDGTQQFEIVFS
ncbi:hypothetical protein PL11_003270 [Lentilactobacillus curieae]|uniref:Uncharacterized protein n=1 Tax=Lentilactobacillus curieae TaxID=1138822 RepID=A0A1S6QHB3_9LACO|nr:hypothetical protein [Lentilactobacillus curieae]AQW21006.1 hypothetical protein PL11_003270 [Lentilactobacillus curieae]